MKESGAIFAVPTYLFVISMVALIALGIANHVVSGEPPRSPDAAHLPPASEALSLFLLLKAFSAGCTAMTGVEAISNGVPAFQQPESKNAATTLLWMVGMLGFMFLGISVLSYFYGAAPREDQSVLSQIASWSSPMASSRWVCAPHCW